jgi:hypothetical protein
MSTGWTARAMLQPGLVEWMAWRRYLVATRASSSATYPTIEEAAWFRLQEDLARLGSPRSADPSFVAPRATARAPADPRG